ncbi:hypothetical protein Tco_0450853 [Tanacetum coccineum]
MDSSRWTEIYEGINKHLQKPTKPKQGFFQDQALKQTPPTGTSMQGLNTHEYPSLALTPTGEHTLMTGYSLRMRTARIYVEMKGLGYGEYTEMNQCLARGGSFWAHSRVGRVLPSRAHPGPSARPRQVAQSTA